MTSSRPASCTLTKPEIGKRTLSAFECNLVSQLQKVRTFLDDHALQIRSDSHHIRHLRHKNMLAYFRLQEQNIILSILRKAIIAKLKATQRQLKHNSAEVAVYATNTSKTQAQRDANSIHDHDKARHKRKCACRVEKRDHLESNLEFLNIFLTAIGNVQRAFRRVRWVKFQESLIKNSTLPVLTLQNDNSTPGRGLVCFSDRLLHAAYLEDLIERCLVKQNYLLSEAENKTTAAFLGIRLYKMTH